MIVGPFAMAGSSTTPTGGCNTSRSSTPSAQKPRVAGRLFGFGSLFISHVSIPIAFVLSAVPSRSGRVPLPGSLLFRTEMSCRLHVLMEHAHNHQIPFCLAIIDDVLSHGVGA